jgi:hypothetical protein
MPSPQTSVLSASQSPIKPASWVQGPAAPGQIIVAKEDLAGEDVNFALQRIFSSLGSGDMYLHLGTMPLMPTPDQDAGTVTPESVRLRLFPGNIARFFEITAGKNVGYAYLPAACATMGLTGLNFLTAGLGHQEIAGIPGTDKITVFMPPVNPGLSDLDLLRRASGAVPFELEGGMAWPQALGAVVRNGAVAEIDGACHQYTQSPDGQIICHSRFFPLKGAMAGHFRAAIESVLRSGMCVPVSAREAYDHQRRFTSRDMLILTQHS